MQEPRVLTTIAAASLIGLGGASGIAAQCLSKRLWRSRGVEEHREGRAGFGTIRDSA